MYFTKRGGLIYEIGDILIIANKKERVEVLDVRSSKRRHGIVTEQKIMYGCYDCKPSPCTKNQKGPILYFVKEEIDHVATIKNAIPYHLLRKGISK